MLRLEWSSRRGEQRLCVVASTPKCERGCYKQRLKDTLDGRKQIRSALSVSECKSIFKSGFNGQLWIENKDKIAEKRRNVYRKKFNTFSLKRFLHGVTYLNWNIK
jgi:hypothetical protein